MLKRIFFVYNLLLRSCFSMKRKEKTFRQLAARTGHLDHEIRRIEKLVSAYTADNEDSLLALSQRMYLAGLKKAKELLFS